jgi:hypothetical protein
MFRKILGYVQQSATAALLERGSSFLKMILLTSGFLSLREVDQYFLQLVTISLIFTSSFNTLEYVVNNNRKPGEWEVFRAVKYTALVYPILMIIYVATLWASGLSSLTILLFGIFSSQYVLGFLLQIHARSQNLYWNNLSSEICQSVFICAALVSGLLDDFLSLLITSVIAQFVGIVILLGSSNVRGLITTELTLNFSFLRLKMLCQDLCSKNTMLYLGVTLLWALNHAVDRYLYDYLTVDLVSISALAFALVIVPIQLANLEKISLLLFLKNRKTTSGKTDIDYMRSILLIASTLSIAVVCTVALLGYDGLLFIFGFIGYPSDKAEILISILFAYLASLPAIMLIGTIDQILITSQRSFHVLCRQVSTIGLNVALSCTAVLKFGFTIVGVALATSVVYWLVLLVQTQFLRFKMKALADLLMNIILSFAFMVFVTWVLSQYFDYRLGMLFCAFVTASFLIVKRTTGTLS